MSLYCPKCRIGIHLKDAVFCYHDGTPLEEKPKCKHCGADTIASYTHCHRCGVKQIETIEERNKRLNAELAEMPFEGAREDEEEIRP